MAMKEGNNSPLDDRGWFEKEQHGLYERNFLLNEEDLKMTF